VRVYGAAALRALLTHPELEHRWTVAAYICDYRAGLTFLLAFCHAAQRPLLFNCRSGATHLCISCCVGIKRVKSFFGDKVASVCGMSLSELLPLLN
jgi:hypothetical protein